MTLGRELNRGKNISGILSHRRLSNDASYNIHNNDNSSNTPSNNNSNSGNNVPISSKIPAKVSHEIQI
jgi:hypothetical protein